MAELNPLSHTGRVLASTTNAGVCQLNSASFAVDGNGVVSIKAGGTSTAQLADDAVTAAKVADGAIATAALDPTTIQYATVTLTNANIKALRATPITLVAAPGAGKVIEFVSGLLKLNAGTNVLTESADNMAVKYTDGSGVVISTAIEATDFIDQAADTYTNAVPVADAIVVATGAENKAIVLHNTGDGEYAGNAANDATMTVGVAYRVHTL